MAKFRRAVKTYYLRENLNFYVPRARLVCSYINLPYPVKVPEGKRDYVLVPYIVGYIFQHRLFKPDFFYLNPPYFLIETAYNMIFDAIDMPYYFPAVIAGEVVASRRMVFLTHFNKWYKGKANAYEQGRMLWRIGQVYRPMSYRKLDLERDDKYLYLRGHPIVEGKYEENKFWIPYKIPNLVSKSKYKKCFISFVPDWDTLLKLNEKYLPIYKRTGIPLYVLTRFADKNFDFQSLRVLTWKDQELEGMPIAFLYVKWDFETFFIRFSYDIPPLPITKDLEAQLYDLTPNTDQRVNYSAVVHDKLLLFYDHILEKWGEI